MRLRLNIGILICILLMAQTAYAEYAENGEVATPISMPEITSGDTIAHIVILQELIEVDISNAEYIAVKELIVFRATENYTSDLMTWVPNSAVDVRVSRQSMTENTQPVQIPHIKEGNIVRFNDTERTSTPGMPKMYGIEYVIQRTPQDEELEYNKILQYPTYINYPISSLVIKIVPAQGMEVIIKDEGGNEIKGDNIETEDNGIVHSWLSPQIKEFSISTKSKSNITGILPYIAIGFIVLVIFAFPFVQKKMKRETDEVFVGDAGTFEDDGDDDSNRHQDELDVNDDADLDQPDLDELESRYDAIFSLLNEIKADRDNGDISDKEYETLSKKYKSEAIDLMKTIDELQEQLGQ